MDIGLVSCTKSKREKAVKPADLYMESAFFRKAGDYVETNHVDWLILSAKHHHLLDPDGPPTEHYDETLSGASVDTKRKRSRTIYDQLQRQGLLADGNILVFHTGPDYYDELPPLLEDTAVRTETPTDGLQFGKTLAWYNERI
jgi:hypothetical protein